MIILHIDNSDDLLDIPSYLVEFTSEIRPKRFENYESKAVYVQHDIKKQVGDSIMSIPDEKFEKIVEDYKKMCKFGYKTISINDLDTADLLTHSVVIMRNMGLSRLVNPL